MPPGGLLVKKQDLWRFSQAVSIAVKVLVLAVIVLAFASFRPANDSVDYYVMLEKTVRPFEKPIVDNYYFADQRLPGYPLLAVPAYLAAELVISPLAETFTDRPPEGVEAPKVLEKPELIPRPVPLLGMLYRNIELPNGSVLDWRIAFALVFTSYFFFIAGLFFVFKSLGEKPLLGMAAALALVLSSAGLVSSLVDTPAFATLTAFGLSAAFAFYFLRALEARDSKSRFLSGVFLGLLAITRPEGFAVSAIIIAGLAFWREWDLLKKLALGFAAVMPLLFAFNLLFSGNAFNASIFSGDINRVGFSTGYAFDNLLNPSSGIVFWSFLTVLGIAGLFLAGEKGYRLLGFCALAVILLMLFRIPAMYECEAGKPLVIGGIDVKCPESTAEKTALVKSDANRYLVSVSAFAMLGLAGLAGKAMERIKGKAGKKARGKVYG